MQIDKGPSYLHIPKVTGNFSPVFHPRTAALRMFFSAQQGRWAHLCLTYVLQENLLLTEVFSPVSVIGIFEIDIWKLNGLKQLITISNEPVD